MEEPELRQAIAGDGTRLQYEVLGAADGAPLVFLHGGMSGRYAFRRQRALGERFRLILRDLRGWNGSEARVPAGYSLDTTEVTDLLAVLDAEGIERAHLVGHSTGGAIAYAFAWRHPERVLRLVLIEPTLLSFASEETRQGFQTDDEARARITREGPKVSVHLGFEKLMGPDWRQRVRPETLAAMEASAEINLAQAEALVAFTVSEQDLRDLQIPTLLLYGRDSWDWETTIRDRIQAVRPDLPVAIIEGAAHNVHVDQPERVNAVLSDFLG